MIRKRTLAAVTGIALSATAAHADVPVVDAAGDASLITQIENSGQQLINAVKSYALQLEQYVTELKTYVGDELSWLTQAKQYATQLQQYANDLQLFMNFYHNPSLGAAMGIMNGVGLGSIMPFSPYAVMSLVNGFQYGGGGIPQITGLANVLNGLVGSAYTTNHVYTPTDGSWGSQQVIARANGIAGEQGSAMGA